MVNFKCYSCPSEFNDQNSALDHLKTVHRVREKVDRIQCVVNLKCSKTFQTWSGLKKHMKTCSSIANEGELNDDRNCELIDNCTHANISDEDDTRHTSKIPVSFDNNFNNIEVESMNSGYSDNTRPMIEEDELDYHSRMVDYFRGFAFQVESLSVAQNVKDCIFKFSKELLKQSYEFSCASIKQVMNTTNDHISEVLQVSQYEILNEIEKYDSTYKRNKLCKENRFYVKPEEKAIGTHWETKRDPKTQKKYPVHKQSILQYVPITETLKSLFRQDHFKKLYFDYNAEMTGSKHKCTQGNFKDYCCGEVYKNNRLFAEYPESIQLQIFNDGFEMCDALKSKSNLHSQMAFYFTIRNLPQELAFNLDNIHLVVLCNSNDVNTPQTDYNNIWKLIVDDLACLESIGIDTGDGFMLKGIFKIE